MPEEPLPDADHIQMLVDLLLRFPEIYTITLNLPSASCHLSYMIRRELAQEQFTALERQLQEIMETFCFLNRCPERCRFAITRESEQGLTRVQLTLGCEPFLDKLISLITAIMHEHFPEELIVEQRSSAYCRWPENGFTGELTLPGDSEQRSGRLSAFRDSGKVYIFDH
jgi:hypothetical protein